MSTVIPKDQIISASRLLFFRSGIRTITMDRIATHLGISKKTIYHHFRDKNLLVKSLTQSELDRQQLDLEKLRAESLDSIDEIVKVMAYLSVFFDSINPSLFYDMQKYHPESWKIFHQYREKQMIGLVEENLQRGIREQLYRKELKKNIIARLRIEEVELGFNPEKFAPKSFSIPEVQIELLNHFLHGIVTMKGYKLIEKYKYRQRIKIKKD